VISCNEETRVTLMRVERFQQQVILLRQVEKNPTNYRLSAEGYLAEIDRMNLAVRDYLSMHPSEVVPIRGMPVDSK